MKKAWMPITPSRQASAKTSASPTPGVDRLRPLDEGQRLEPIAQHRGELEVHRLGRLGHLRAQLGLHLGRLAREEVLRVADQFGIFLDPDPPDARRRATLDLVEQARPVARLEEAVGA